jgi:hypothetical protein
MIKARVMDARYNDQQLIQQHVSVLQNNYTLNVTLKMRAQDSNLDDIKGAYTGISDEIYFLICQSCFWCASYISTQFYKRNTEKIITKCPFCNSGNIESIPIAENEKYRFKYDKRRGITMMFF